MAIAAAGIGPSARQISVQPKKPDLITCQRKQRLPSIAQAMGMSLASVSAFIFRLLVVYPRSTSRSKLLPITCYHGLQGFVAE